MPRYNVELPDGTWRVFSTIVDDFVTDPMTFDELKDYRLDHYASPDAETESLLTDKPRCNRMSYEDACWRIENLGVEEDE